MNANEREAAISAVCSLGIVAKNIPAAELGKALRIERAATEERDGQSSARFRALIVAVEALVWFTAANDELLELFGAGATPAAEIRTPAPTPPPAEQIPDDWAAPSPR